MKKVILHLGPPKTGTTTIQSILYNQYSDNLISAKSKNKDLSDRIMSYVKAETVNVLSGIKEEIYNLHSNFDTLIYSDERVLLEYTPQNSWRAQLIRLSEIFNFPNIELQIIICLRDPVDALPSLYQQLRNTRWVSKLSIEKFVMTRQASIFNYEILERELVGCGFSNITYFRFELLQKREMDLGCFGITNFIASSEARNKSIRNKNNRIHNYTVTDILRKNLGVFSPIFPKSLKQSIAKKLRINLSQEIILLNNSKIPTGFSQAYNERKEGL